LNLDQSAKAFWIPHEIVSTTVSGGADREFETLRSAVFFVMERLPEFERATAFINTDEPDGHYSNDKIREIYNGLRLENSKPSRDEAAIPPIPPEDEPYDGSPI
jgi:hypothetical protein